MKILNRQGQPIDTHEEAFWAIIQCSSMKWKYESIFNAILEGYLQKYAFVQHAIEINPINKIENAISSWHIYQLPSMNYFCKINNITGAHLPVQFHCNTPESIMGHSIEQNPVPKPFTQKQVMDTDYYQFLSLLDLLNDFVYASRAKNQIRQAMYEFLHDCKDLKPVFDDVYKQIQTSTQERDDQEPNNQ